MNNEKLNQIRESISDAILSLSQLGDDAAHTSALIAQKRLARLSDLEFAVLSGGAQDEDERPDLRQEILGCMDFLAGLAKSDISANKMRKLARNEYYHLSSVVANLDDNDEWNERPAMWVSVLDRLPERGVTVMVFSQDGEIYFDEIDGDCDDGDRWYAHDQSYEHYCNVAKPAGSAGPDCEAPYTHWMPLPKPPAE